MHGRSIVKFFAGCTIPLLFGVVNVRAELPQLWPTFSKPATVVNIEILNSIASPDDLLAEKTLMGAYNQLQKPSRLYLSNSLDDSYWLRTLSTYHVAVTSLPWDHSDPDGALKALLARYGSKIAGYYVCDPVNIPETCNMATTLAGIHQAMVVNSDNIPVVSAFKLPLLSDFRSKIWIGNDPDLVNNANINLVDNPSGRTGITGWKTSGMSSAQTLTTGPYHGTSVLKWTTGKNQDAGVYFEPKVTSGTGYCFSAQVAGAGRVFLDVWDGVIDHTSAPVNLAINAFQTLQSCIQIRVGSSAQPVKLEIRVAQTGRLAATVYVINAAVVESAVAVEAAAYKYISGTSSLALAQDANELYNKRDYDVAAKMFTFNLTSTDQAQKWLYRKILEHTAHDTPVTGYPMIERFERPDVAFLSGPDEGHFLTASARYDNGSVWASLPQISKLSQAAPVPVKAMNGTIYVAFAASEGDNMTYVEHRMQSLWTGSQFMGAVPMGWTIPPGAIVFSPAMLAHFFSTVPQSSELIAGPGGVGYATALTGSDLAKFGAYTHEFMKAEDLRTVNSWQWKENEVPPFAAAAAVPHLVWRFPRAYAQIAATVVDGQDVTYNYTPAKQIAAIETYAKENYSSDKPLFIEALSDAWHLSPDDVLYIAQQLQLRSTHPYVFLTPSEMAMTEAAYHKGTGNSLPTTNAQAVTGASLVVKYPVNVLLNGDTLSSGAAIGLASWHLGAADENAGLLPTQYKGEHVELLMAVPGFRGVVEAESNVNVPVAGQYYLFSLRIAGAGKAQMCVFDGSKDVCTRDVHLSASFQSVSETVQMKSATGGLVRLKVEGPHRSAASAYFQFVASNPSYWFYSRPGTGNAATADLSTTLYRGSPAFRLVIPARQGNDQWVTNIPIVTAGFTYTFAVDVAGSGRAYLEAFDGSRSYRSAVIALRGTYRTLSISDVSIGNGGTAQLRIGSSNDLSQTTIFFRNASVATSSATTDFYTGLEATQPALKWMHVVASGAGGGDTNVARANVKVGTWSISHSGANAIEYVGIATGGKTTHSYLEAFSENIVMKPTSRLSYWILPVGTRESEGDGSSTPVASGTCVTLDMVFADGTALRNSPVTDQSGNFMNPADECHHLIPGQWNYVTADLSSVAGKVVKSIDIGYDQPGANGNYRGFIDDISITH
jgi:hypothetical protein